MEEKAVNNVRRWVISHFIPSDCFYFLDLHSQKARRDAFRVAILELGSPARTDDLFATAVPVAVVAA